MEQPSLEMILFLLSVGFVAAFVDSVVGGGGLISVPALLWTGLPPAVVLGTNKLGGTISSLTSSVSFLLSGKMDIRLVRKWFPLSLLGSVAGAYTVRLIPPDFLKPLVVVMLVVVTLYTLLVKKRTASSSAPRLSGKMIAAGALVALILGYYDGFFGPGTGSFLLFAFLLLRFDFVVAAGNAKALNLASNAGSLVTFALMGNVNLYYGIPLGLAMLAGALIGSRVAIRRGAGYVKPLFVAVTTLLIGKQIWDLLHG
ncbi:sulfite exporter TauE/SafE family protein [Paenibacillus hodogayensis]|uniref:Probable membrane transporter protein n=1 Tax=Paenibacillus hodogayensis TaxID=279208 RepID=A0ABV5VRS1_9BACL